LSSIDTPLAASSACVPAMRSRKVASAAVSAAVAGATVFGAVVADHERRLEA